MPPRGLGPCNTLVAGRGQKLVVTWILHWRVHKSGSIVLPKYLISIELLGVGVIALTAHLGGFLSGVNS